MKNLIILGFIMALTLSCSKDKETKSVATWGEEPIEKTEERKIVYTKADIVSDGINSYWFVVVQRKKDGVMMNAFIHQAHSYFSSKETLKHFGEPKEYFLLNFEEVSQATFIEANTE
jgi:hypothetical protein